jgi:hypothetical protein
MSLIIFSQIFSLIMKQFMVSCPCICVCVCVCMSMLFGFCVHLCKSYPSYSFLPYFPYFEK